MATVISLTKEKIEELLAGYEGVALSQDQIHALIQQMWVAQATQNARMEEIENVEMPALSQAVTDNSNQVSEVAGTLIPDLEAGVAQNQAQINDLLTVTIPSLQTDLSNTAQNVLDSPKVYREPEEPTNPDEDGRDLILGDTWFDTDDDNKQRMWNGAQWSDFGVDVADFSLTAKKFHTSTHMIY